MTADRHGLGPDPTGPGSRSTPSAEDLALSFARLAHRMPTSQPGIASAALREAEGIRRRRSGLVAAAVAAAFVVAVPLTWQLARSTAPVQPAAPSQGVVSTSGGLPSSGTGGSAVDRPRLVALDLGAAPTGRQAWPYVVDGLHHGDDGTTRIAVTDGLVDVLDLAGGAKVLTVGKPGPSGRTIVQDRAGRVLSTLEGVVGRPVANVAGDRVALVDDRSGRVLLLGPDGSVLAVLADHAARTAVGFNSDDVLFTSGDQTWSWTPVTDEVRRLDVDQVAVDASDQAGLALFVGSVQGTTACWSVRSTRDPAAPVVARSCGGYLPERLSGDGRFVLGRDLPLRTDSPVVVASTASSRALLSVWLPAGTTAQSFDWLTDGQELVLNVVTSNGSDSIVGCPLASATCEVLVPAMPNPAWPKKEAPYVLARR